MSEVSQEMQRLMVLDTKSLFPPDDLIDRTFLEHLSFFISKRPECLIAHVQRIYCCFMLGESERLYGAFADLLVILNKRGRALSRRLLAGVKSLLSSEQIQSLLYFCEVSKTDISALPGNRYSIFSSGLIGEAFFIKFTEDYNEVNLDPLSLAKDFIEYSQLDEARIVLEDAIIERPERHELHDELLTLYRLTRDSDNFFKLHAQLLQVGIDLPEGWDQTVLHFQQLK